MSSGHRPMKHRSSSLHSTNFVYRAACSLICLRVIKMSLFHRVQCPPNVPLLVVLDIVARIAAQGHPHAFRMREIAVTAFASPIDKPGLFQVGSQLAHLARHFSIRVVSHLLYVNTVKHPGHGWICCYWTCYRWAPFRKPLTCKMVESRGVE